MIDATDLRRSYPPDATLGNYGTRDGWALRTFDRPAAGKRGSILWLGGRGDIFEKYLESMAAWHDAGWHISSFDWRGQGGSGRLLADRRVGHIDDFSVWLADLTAFWRDWTARTPAPHVIMGHSMGGHLVLRGLVEARIAPRAAVLSAPMLGFAGRIPQPVASIVARLLGTIAPRKSAWKQNERPAPPDASRQAFLTCDAQRYADELWWKSAKPELDIGPPSWGWMAASSRSFAAIHREGAVEAIRTPVLTVATDGDLLVNPGAIRRTAARLARGELLMFDKSVAHEVLREIDSVRDVAMARISQFLDREAPPQ